MSTMTGVPFDEGGFIPGWDVTARIDPDECIVNRDMECTRTDEAHHYEPIALSRLGDASPRYVRGPCLHRHTVPVNLAVTGERVARLCRNCSAQLPA